MSNNAKLDTIRDVLSLPIGSQERDNALVKLAQIEAKEHDDMVNMLAWYAHPTRKTLFGIRGGK